jgi:hypothetical protein
VDPSTLELKISLNPSGREGFIHFQGISTHSLPKKGSGENSIKTSEEIVLPLYIYKYTRLKKHIPAECFLINLSEI